MMRNSGSRAFTLVEMLVAMACMGIIMSLAALEFKDVVYGYLYTESHITSEQQARLALAKVDELSRQASVVDSQSPGPAPLPAILEPSSTPGPRLVYTQVADLNTKTMPLCNGAPCPCYDKVQIYIAPPSSVPGGDPALQPHNLVEQIDPQDPLRGQCVPTQPAPESFRLLARNVEDFEVQPVSCQDQGDCSYLQGYRVDITTFNYDENALDNHAGAAYHISSVITPIVYGKAN